MAVAVDNVATLNQETNSSSVSFNKTNGTSTTLLVVMVAGYASTTSVSYNSVAMTKLVEVGPFASAYNSIWYLQGPTADGAAHAVALTMGSSNKFDVTAISFTGAGGLGAFNSTNGATGNPTLAVTTSRANGAVIDNVFWDHSDNSTSSATAPQTIKSALANTGSNAAQTTSFKTTTTAGSYTMSWTRSGTDSDWIQVVAEIFAPDFFWIGGTGNWNDGAHWSFLSGGSAASTTPAAENNVYFDGNSGGGTSTVNAGTSMSNLTTTGYTGTLAGSSALNVAGSLVFGSGITNSYTGTMTMSSTATGKTITTNGKSFGGPLVFDGVGGGWTLSDVLTSTSSVTLTNGTLSLNNLSHSFGSFASSNSNARTLTMGSGTLTLTGTGTVWNTATPYSMVLSKGTSTIKINDASSSGKTFSGGGLTFYNLWLTGAGTGAFTIVGSNTFNDFKCDTPPHTINFTAAATQYLNTFTVNGTAGNLMTLQSTVSGSAWYLVNMTTTQISCDYLSLKDSHVRST